jgi:pyruvate/2-oxoglutarate dehydrogenase complex dihydrolipoamide dehydrogenase (E3) component
MELLTAARFALADGGCHDAGQREAAMSKRYDAIIIGGGQSGPFLAVRLANAGRTVAMIEREHMGGTCVNNGCIPTKTMVASARAAHVARNAAKYGVITGPVSVDYGAVKRRKDEIVAGSVKGLVDWLDATKGVTTIWGEARFTGPHEVEVKGEKLTAPQIFINAGGRPVVPDWPGLSEVPYLTNVSMMELSELPSHLVVVGGSYIGLEFAQMFRRFGSAVTVVEHGERLISREDEDISSSVQQILEAEGIVFHFGARDFSVRRDGTGTVLSFSSKGAPQQVRGSHLLVATGRRPNSDGLGLEAAGIATDGRGIITVNDRLETNVPGVFALGDINGRGAFTHTSYNDFEIVAANLLDGGDRKVSERIPANNLYIDPPLGRVGLSETEVKARGIKALKGVLPMTRVGRARERGETQGFMKVLVDAQSKLILGAALLGIEADEVVQSILHVMAAKAPYTLITETMHIHPTVSELLPSLFEAMTEV